MAVCFHGASEGGVNGFDGVGGADDTSYVHIELKKWRELGPCGFPESYCGSVFTTPGSGEFTEAVPRGSLSRGGIDRSQVTGYGVPISAGGEAERVADQMDIMPMSA